MPKLNFLYRMQRAIQTHSPLPMPRRGKQRPGGAIRTGPQRWKGIGTGTVRAWNGVFLPLLAVVCLVCRPAGGQTGSGNWLPAQLVTTSGSVLEVEIGSSRLDFLSVDGPGNSRSVPIDLETVSSLRIVVNPEANAVSAVGALILALDDPSYDRRVAAEEQLAKQVRQPEVRALVEAATGSDSLEVRHRAKRLLQSTGQASPEQQVRLQYDRVQLRDGTILQGDAGDLTLQVRWRGSGFPMRRASIQSVVFERPPAGVQPQRSPSGLARLFHQPSPEAVPPDLFIDFETGMDGRKLVRRDNVGQEYLDRGVLLRAYLDEKTPAVAQISPYPFNFGNKPTGGNSIYVCREENPLRTPFRGTTLVGFCMPHQAFSAAAVHRFSIYAARTDYPLSFVMQCLNSHGQLVAEVLSGDEDCSWFSVDSPEPISEIRILSNPLALQMDTPVDEDYALDSMALSVPVPSVPLLSGPSGVLHTANGETLTGGRIVVDQGQFSILETTTGRTSSFPPEETGWWIQPNSSPAAPEHAPRWMALLGDRSVVEIEWRDGRLCAAHHSQLEIDGDAVVALWSARSMCRFPVEGDFEFGPRVLVFPACRVATRDVQATATGLVWESEGKVELFQPVLVTQSADNVPDPTGRTLAAKPELAPAFSSLNWTVDDQWNLPTVWFRAPPPVPPDVGFVSLDRGEEIAFGTGANCRLKAVGVSALELETTTGRVLELPWDRIWRMAFPSGPPAAAGD